MTRLQDIPIAKLVLPYVTGLALPIPISNEDVWALVLVTFVGLFIVERPSVPSLILHRAINAGFLLMGVLIGLLYQSPLDHVAKGELSGDHWVELVKHSRSKPGNLRAEFRLLASSHSDSLPSRIVGTLVNVEAVEVPLGTRFLIRGTLRPITGPTYPGQFDARAYYRSIGVTHGIWSDHWVRLSGDIGIFHRIRQYSVELTQRFKDHFDPMEAGILAALVLGERHELQQDVRQAFIDSGTVHVLAVSGLHVGALFSLLSMLGRWLRVGRSATWAVLVIVIIWGYAILSGTGWPVVRAAFMFSIMQWSMYRNGVYNPLNALLLSAYFSLLIEPSALGQLSFQFSYLALAGILFVYPRIRSFVKLRTPGLRSVPDLLILGFSAQYFLFPLSVLMFGQFPLHFPVGNLLVVPYMIILFYSGAGILLFSFFGGMPELVLKAMNLLLEYVMEVTAWLASYEAAILKGISWDVMDLVVVYSALLLLLVFRGWYARSLLLIAIAIWFTSPTERGSLLVPISQQDDCCFALIRQNKAMVLQEAERIASVDRKLSTERILLALRVNEVEWAPFELVRRPHMKGKVEFLEGGVEVGGMKVGVHQGMQCPNTGAYALCFHTSKAGWSVHRPHETRSYRWGDLHRIQGLVIEP